MAGIAFFIAAAVWLALAVLIPRYVPGEIVTGLVVGLGLACLVAATVISFWVVYRKR